MTSAGPATTSRCRRLDQRPDGYTLHAGPRVGAGSGGTAPVGPASVVGVRADPAGRPLEVTPDRPGGRLLTVTMDPAADELRLSTGASPPLRPGPDGAVGVRLLLDARVAEVFSCGAVAVARLPPVDGGLTLRLAGAADARLPDLTVQGLERLTG